MSTSPSSSDRCRCPWCGASPDYIAYHDTEWGVPVTDERMLFERLSLEGFQSGLSWLTILRRRDGFRRAFHDFDPRRVAAMDDADALRLLDDTAIIRHRGKIEATIGNAKALLDLHTSGESLAEMLWTAAPSRRRSAPRSLTDLEPQTVESKELSRRLRAAGFRFVGPTTLHAAMQAVGIVNDHLAGCFRRAECERLRRETAVPGR